ncbi:MAG: transglutaminase N-terminal domain-containing protein, partial [Byssovorax sp.]
MNAARYHVVHETRYEYHQPVGLSRQVVRLAPRVIPWQLCRSHALRIAPDAEILAVRADAFGNPVTSFAIEADHASLAVRAESWVDVAARAFPDDAATPPWEKVRARLAYRGGCRPLPADLDAARFLFESTRVRNKRELSAWTLASFPPGAPLLVGVRALMNRIHRDFTFDPKATD